MSERCPGCKSKLLPGDVIERIAADGAEVIWHRPCRDSFDRAYAAGCAAGRQEMVISRRGHLYRIKDEGGLEYMRPDPGPGKPVRSVEVGPDTTEAEMDLSCPNEGCPGDLDSLDHFKCDVCGDEFRLVFRLAKEGLRPNRGGEGNE